MQRTIVPTLRIPAGSVLADEAAPGDHLVVVAYLGLWSTHPAVPVADRVRLLCSPVVAKALREYPRGSASLTVTEEHIRKWSKQDKVFDRVPHAALVGTRLRTHTCVTAGRVYEMLQEEGGERLVSRQSGLFTGEERQFWGYLAASALHGGSFTDAGEIQELCDSLVLSLRERSNPPPVFNFCLG